MKFIVLCCFGLCFTLTTYSQDTIPFDPYFDAPYDLIQDRIVCIEDRIPLNFNDKVRSFVDFFTIRNRLYTREILEKKNLYFPIFERTLAKYGMPDELKYLSIIESGLRPTAVSRVGACGLWQFMPATGRSFGLSQTWYIDERMNPELATEAACKYLNQLYGMFGDWELALASYNAGPGNVRKAIRKSDNQQHFWAIYPYLPRETRSYVPQFVAMIYTMKYADEHNFHEGDYDVKYPMHTDTVHVHDYLHMETLANQLNLCHDELLGLNPQIVRGAIPDGVKGYPLNVPADVAAHFRENRTSLLDSANKVGREQLDYLTRSTPGSTFGKERQIYRVRSGDVLGSIASRHHVSVSEIQKWNNMSGTVIQIGQNLNIWVIPTYSSQAQTTTAVQQPATLQVATVQPPAQLPNSKYHLVQSGDSLWSIANLYQDMSVDKLKSLNNLVSSRITPGQKLLISK